MPHDYLPARIALVLNGLAMMILYPLNMVVLERASWIWDYPDRNLAMEHMLVAVYVTMGAFLVWATRDPVKALPLIDFVIVSGAIHATTMAFDAARRACRGILGSAATSSGPILPRSPLP
jgi:uncharacterized protein DUF6632